jgi:hypothetical protein
MFYGAFRGCTGLTGQSARTSDGVKLYTKFSAASGNQIRSCYTNCAGLDDYTSIPPAWK